MTLDVIALSHSGRRRRTGPAGLRVRHALAAIHYAGAVNRHLKPGNVMISDGEPVVIDFGIAQLPDTTKLTMTGMFMGTPRYLAPEVIQATSWRLRTSTGHEPSSRSPRPGELLFMHVLETIFFRIVNGKPDLSGVPGPMAELLAAALRRDPAQRPAAIAAAQPGRPRWTRPSCCPWRCPRAACRAGQPGMAQPGIALGPGTRADGVPLRPPRWTGSAGTAAGRDHDLRPAREPPRTRPGG